MKNYIITVPIAGHAVVEVEAENEEEAKEKMWEYINEKHIESFEFLERFSEGNVCYCPSPWSIEVIEE